MSTFVLIHGAWHGAWCWELAAPLLEAAGHRAIALDLPGMGADPTPLSQVTLERWARFVVEVINAEDEPVVLVGHSRAGVVISQAAEYAPDRITSLVYLAAFLVPNGRTVLQTMQSIPPRPESEGSLVLSADGTSTIAPHAVQDIFYNTTAAQLVNRAAGRVGPEPMSVFTTPLQLTAERWGKVPRDYIRCTRDRAIAPDLQHKMLHALPCRRVVTMDTDHSPFYSAPERLSAELVALVQAGS